MKKAKEWQNITSKINELTGKSRTGVEIKLAWKRMKLAAKANVLTHRQQQMSTGGGEKPKSPSEEDLAIMAIAPYDFIVEVNDHDSDAVPTAVELNPPCPSTNFDVNLSQHTLENTATCYENTEAGPKGPVLNPTRTFKATIEIDPGTPETNRHTTAYREKHNIPRKKTTQNKKEMAIENIQVSNAHFKEKQLEMLEVEHSYNVKIAQLKMKKLELEIDLLELKKKSSNDN